MKDNILINKIKSFNKIIDVEKQASNLYIITSYIFKQTNDCLTFYILETKDNYLYLCDNGNILEIAEELNIEYDLIVKNLTKYNLEIEETNIFCEINETNIEESLDNFICFAKFINIIE